MSRERDMRMVRSVEEIAVIRANEQLSRDPTPVDPRCRGTGGRRGPDGCCLRCGGSVRREKLVPSLIRLSASDSAAIHALAERTKVPLSAYYREAVADLLAKYGATL